MRSLTTAVFAVAALLVTSVAGAAPPIKETGKGAQGPEAAGPSPTEGPETTGADSRRTADQADATSKEREKSWEVSALWETHHMIVQEDISAGILANVFSFSFAYNFTKNDRVWLRGGVDQAFLADQGETGFRFGDLALAYSHRFVLPAGFTITPTASVTAPSSYGSQVKGDITNPRLSLGIEKKFGKYFSMDARVLGTAYIMRYSSAAGLDGDGNGSPNQHWALSVVGEADLAMPFLESLSIGVSAATGYVWMYDVGTAPLMSTYYGAVAGAGQPVQQDYGGEVFVRYDIPSLAGIRSDITLALADGDPALGYNSLLHDGVQHVYGFFRQSASVYGVLAARY